MDPLREASWRTTCARSPTALCRAARKLQYAVVASGMAVVLTPFLTLVVSGLLNVESAPTTYSQVSTALTSPAARGSLNCTPATHAQIFYSIFCKEKKVIKSRWYFFIYSRLRKKQNGWTSGLLQGPFQLGPTNFIAPLFRYPGKHTFNHSESPNPGGCPVFLFFELLAARPNIGSLTFGSRDLTQCPASQSEAPPWSALTGCCAAKPLNTYYTRVPQPLVRPLFCSDFFLLKMRLPVFWKRRHVDEEIAAGSNSGPINWEEGDVSSNGNSNADRRPERERTDSRTRYSQTGVVANTAGTDDLAYKLWGPFFLRKIFLFALIALFIVIGIVLAVLFSQSNQYDGFSTARDGFYYLWTYGPTAGIPSAQIHNKRQRTTLILTSLHIYCCLMGASRVPV